MRIGRPGTNVRSLVELTAAASCAVDDSLFVTSAGLAAVSADKTVQSEQESLAHTMKRSGAD